MLKSILLIMLLGYQLCMYGSERIEPFDLQEYALITFVEMGMIPKLNSIVSEIDCFYALADQEVRQYSKSPIQDIDSDELTLFFEKDSTFEKMLERVGQKGCELYTILKNLMIDFYTISLVNKTMCQKLHSHFIIGQQALYPVFIKLYPFVRADSFIKAHEVGRFSLSADYRRVVSFFAVETVVNYIQFVNDSLVKDKFFGKIFFITGALSTPVERANKKIKGATMFFLDQDSTYNREHDFFLTIPNKDILSLKRSLLWRMCIKKNVHITLKTRVFSDFFPSIEGPPVKIMSRHIVGVSFTCPKKLDSKYLTI